jgi:hypothetical protein
LVSPLVATVVLVSPPMAALLATSRTLNASLPAGTPALMVS